MRLWGVLVAAAAILSACEDPSAKTAKDAWQMADEAQAHASELQQKVDDLETKVQDLEDRLDQIEANQQ